MLQPDLKLVSAAGFSDPDYAKFSDSVKDGLGIRLADYKEDQMRRRVGMMAKQAKCDSFMAYYSAIQRDSAILKSFLDQMTINVTELMRNPNLFEDLAKNLMPELLKNRGAAPLTVWSAGCSYGAEAYTLAMLLSEISPMPPFKIRGTDIDLSVLAKANAATFTAADMNSVSPERRRKFFMQIDDNTFMPMPQLRQSVQFSKHDLLADAFQPEQYDLILCRNVVIYFTDEAKKRIYEGFYRSLKPNGILFVGGTERLGDCSPVGFELIKPFFYRAVKGQALKKAA